MWRFAVLYFVLFIVFLALVIGPAVAGKFIYKTLADMVGDKGTVFDMLQPTGLNNNDTFAEETGTKLGIGTSHTTYVRSGDPTAAASATGDAQRIRLF